MADFDLRLMAEELGKSIQNLGPMLEKEVQGAIRDVAFGAHAKIISELQSKPHAPVKRQEYLKNLQIGTIPNGYIISLEGDWANRLEDGYSSYSIKDLLLNSKKMVSSGKNTGSPFVKTGKNGQKFAHVPFQKHPFSKDPGVGDLDALIKKISVRNSKGRRQRLTSTFKDLDGVRQLGKVASVNARDLVKAGITDSRLVGLTKYQEKTEGGASKSFYAVFRTVTEASKGWRMPGSSGYGLFPMAERYVEEELNSSRLSPLIHQSLQIERGKGGLTLDQTVSPHPKEIHGL